MAKKRGYDLEDVNYADDFYFNVDQSNYAEAKKALRSNLTKTGEITDLEGQNTLLFVTQNAFKATTAETGRLGVLKLASESQVIAGTNAVNGVTSADLAIRENSVFNITKDYLLGDIDSAIGCTANGVQYWTESTVGKKVEALGSITITISSVVDDISILLTATSLPINAVSGNGVYPEPTLNNKRFAMGVFVTIDSGKLRIDLTKDANQWNTGTYTIYFGYRYYKA